MLVVVQYSDETYDMVIDYRLDVLINEGKVTGYSSPAGWVRVGDAQITDETGLSKC
jgi:hypothetical protein